MPSNKKAAKREKAATSASARAKGKTAGEATKSSRPTGAKPKAKGAVSRSRALEGVTTRARTRKTENKTASGKTATKATAASTKTSAVKVKNVAKTAAKTGAAKTGPAKTGPAKTGPAKTGPAKTGGAALSKAAKTTVKTTVKSAAAATKKTAKAAAKSATARSTARTKVAAATSAKPAVPKPVVVKAAADKPAVVKAAAGKRHETEKIEPRNSAAIDGGANQETVNKARAPKRADAAEKPIEPVREARTEPPVVAAQAAAAAAAPPARAVAQTASGATAEPKTPAASELIQVARKATDEAASAVQSAAVAKPAVVKPVVASPGAPPAAAKPAAPKAAPASKARTGAQKHGFKANEFIVYPAHGVGQIIGLEVQEVAGFSLELFVVSFIKDKMILKVPTSKVASVGMRKLAESETVDKALATLSGRARVKRTMWSRRAQEYEAKINSGDLVTIAEVVRDLYRSDTQPEQSYSERQLYEAALDRMAREIAVVRKLIDSEALKLIEAFLLKGPRRGQKTDADGDDAGDDDVEAAA